MPKLHQHRHYRTKRYWNCRAGRPNNFKVVGLPASTRLATRRIARDLKCYDYSMSDIDDHRCPNCDSAGLIAIHTKAIADELVECRSCMRLYRLAYEPDGITQRLVPV